MTREIPESKKKVVEEFAKLLSSSKVIAIINMENLPTAQLQKMRKQLQEEVLLKMTKRTILYRAIDKAGETKKNLADIKPYLKGMPALMFTSKDPFMLYKKVQSSKIEAPAKVGQIAPRDIEVKAGPTPFAPGPIIGELSQLGFKTMVEEGKIVIKDDHIIAQEGDKITDKIASLLLRFDIKPMEIGLNMTAIYEDGTIYTKDVLGVDEKKVLADILTAYSETSNIMIEIGYITKDNIEIFLIKANSEAKSLATEAGIINKETAQDVLAKAEAQARSLSEDVKLD